MQIYDFFISPPVCICNFIFLTCVIKSKTVEDAVIELTKKLGPNQGLAYITVVESNKVPLLPFVITKTFKVSGVIVQYQ